MRVALLSDIHANGPAMRAVRRAVELTGVDALLVSGDSVGYYYWPGEVLAHLSELDAQVIRGNHEDMLLRVLSEGPAPDTVRQRLGSAGLSCLAELSPADLDRLSGWPATLTLSTDEGRVLMCHGSPGDPVRYVYPDTSDGELAEMSPAGFRWVVMGHTHYPMLREVGGVTFVNPGSVGQPRNGVPGAAWALLDSRAGTVEFHVEEYAWRDVADEARVRDPDRPYLWEVLARTR